MLAAQAARDGVPVRFEKYLGLPHIFPMMLPKLPQAERCLRKWAGACLDFVRGGEQGMQGEGVIVHMPGDREEIVDVRDIAPVSREEMLALAEKASRERKPWTGPSAKM